MYIPKYKISWVTLLRPVNGERLWARID
jgi:hypothetical protein